MVIKSNNLFIYADTCINITKSSTTDIIRSGYYLRVDNSILKGSSINEKIDINTNYHNAKRCYDFITTGLWRY
jgi:hypothetical protein